jgi:epoxyqueuosine reductase
MNNPSLSAQLKTVALEMGLDVVGIAPAAHLALAESSIGDRVRSGMLRDYGFAHKPAGRFTHPETLLPGAKSVVVAAVSYLSLNPQSDVLGLRGRVARFARGRDYHSVLEERLRRLGEWISMESGGGACRICVDTGPMIDRAIAQVAGIGSYGKNCSIITPEFGSWVVLGELIIGVELGSDQPAPLEECGDCSICLKSCPAGAIVEPFVIDQTKCISHLTQMKGSIPEELRPLLGDRIYGCDVCQEVCPKNARARTGSFPTDGGLGSSPDLLPLLNVSQVEFGRLIAPTAIGWIGRTRFRRNVAVALGNAADPAAIPELTKALDDPDPIIRQHVRWAIDRCTPHG